MMGFKTENDLLHQGLDYLAGLDEVGRGSLFGPVVAASVIFPPAFFLGRGESWTREVADSKLLSPTKRMELAGKIMGVASCFGLGYATHQEIDRMNIYWATQLAMKRALADLSQQPRLVLVDGYPLKGINYPQVAVPQGDRKVFSIAAASIVAKVFRDELLQVLDRLYPGYGLSQNKGYATEGHYQAIEKLGPCPLHRQSFKLFRDRMLIE
ncbi:MAG TPA: ribonuclease HII [Acidobacteria bacterium]|nr:ribonuclease HII [Acidobacteriota bacterium]